ncbi:MAG: hypothetical protein ACP5U0_10215 [Caldisphaera sp.]
MYEKLLATVVNYKDPYPNYITLEDAIDDARTLDPELEDVEIVKRLAYLAVKYPKILKKVERWLGVLVHKGAPKALVKMKKGQVSSDLFNSTILNSRKHPGRKTLFLDLLLHNTRLDLSKDIGNFHIGFFKAVKALRDKYIKEGVI